MISVTRISQFVQDADAARIVNLLAMVASWPVNENDPQDFRNQRAALAFINRISRGDIDAQTEARRFLHELRQDARAQKFVEAQ